MLLYRLIADFQATHSLRLADLIRTILDLQLSLELGQNDASHHLDSRSFEALSLLCKPVGRD
jgi:hypothetical protein